MLTVATQVTVARLVLVPVFCLLAVSYSHTVVAGEPAEWLRFVAVTTYIVAAASDGLDGYLARRLNQKSKLGAFLDPIADKSLLLTGLTTLALVSWGENDWRIPLWFLVLVILRDCIILGGIVILYSLNSFVPIRPKWSGKVCTVTQMVALGWVMLKPLPFSPIYPAIVASIFTIWSGWHYIQEGISQLPRNAKQ